MTTSPKKINYSDKENNIFGSNFNCSKTYTTKKKYTHTPPKLRSININFSEKPITTSSKPTQNTEVTKMTSNLHHHHDNEDANEVEDFSFARLKGAVQSFEQRQKAHYSNSSQHLLPHHAQTTIEQTKQQNYKLFELKTNLSNSSNATHSTSATTNSKIITCSSFESMDSHGNSTCTTSESIFTQSVGGDHVDEKDVKKRTSGTIYKAETNAYSSSHSNLSQLHGNDNYTLTNDEDFSFQNLKLKALGMEKEAASNNRVRQPNLDDVEDFSFATLRQKALTPIKTPIKSNNNNKLRRQHQQRQHNRTISQHHAIETGQRYHRLQVQPKHNEIQSKQLQPQTQHQTKGNCKSTTFNPNRFQFKPKIRKEEVQATNDTIASVQKISQWLSDDPFDKKKQLLIRKGEQIANKSKAFEDKELVNGIWKQMNETPSRAKREKHYFVEGKVSENKAWLQNHAFGDNRKKASDKENKNEHICGVMEKKKLIEAALTSKSNYRYS